MGPEVVQTITATFILDLDSSFASHTAHQRVRICPQALGLDSPDLTFAKSCNLRRSFLAPGIVHQLDLAIVYSASFNYRPGGET